MARHHRRGCLVHLGWAAPDHSARHVGGVTLLVAVGRRLACHLTLRADRVQRRYRIPDLPHLTCGSTRGPTCGPIRGPMRPPTFEPTQEMVVPTLTTRALREVMSETTICSSTGTAHSTGMNHQHMSGMSAHWTGRATRAVMAAAIAIVAAIGSGDAALGVKAIPFVTQCVIPHEMATVGTGTGRHCVTQSLVTAIGGASRRQHQQSLWCHHRRCCLRSTRNARRVAMWMRGSWN